MPKKKKTLTKSSRTPQSKTGSLKSFKLKPWHILTGIALFVVGGFVVAFSQAATQTQGRIAQDKVLISFEDTSQPVVLSAPLGAEPSFSLAPQTIDVTTDGTIYCLPANATEGQTGQLPTAKLKDLKAFLAQQAPIQLPEAQTDAVVATQTASFRTADGGPLQTVVTKDVTNINNSLGKLKNSLEKACTNANKPMKRAGKPSFNQKPDVPTASPEAISRLIIPTAHAAIQDPWTQAFDAKLKALVGEYRAQNSKQVAWEQTCLLNMSLWWSQSMADRYGLRHISTVQSYTDTAVFFCANLGSFGFALGENVGWVPLAASYPTPEAAAQKLFDTYKASPEHNANMLDPRWNRWGTTSVLTNDRNNVYNTQEFLMINSNYQKTK
ncbi:MAG: CAP domain-containing protein [Candidatus Saccharibacteria bacterium]